jgi:hypothetical protein
MEKILEPTKKLSEFKNNKYICKRIIKNRELEKRTS